MRHLSAAILLALGGKTVDEASIKAVLTAAGVKPDDAKVKKVVDSVKGKDVLQLCKEGLSKVGSASAASSAPAKKEEKKAEPKKEEKKPEPEEEEAGGFGDLFG